MFYYQINDTQNLTATNSELVTNILRGQDLLLSFCRGPHPDFREAVR